MKDMGRLTIVVMALLAGGCRDTPSTEKTGVSRAEELPALAPVPGLTLVELPGDGLHGSPNLVANADTLVLTGIAHADGGDVVRLYQLSQTGWQQPVDVTAPGRPLFVNWADVPAAIHLHANTLIVVWPERFVDDQGQPTRGYGLQLSRSRDAGKTWDPPVPLHNHHKGPEYGFVSLAYAPAAKPSVVAYWLDGRESRGHEGGQMQLRSAVIEAEGPPHTRTLVDDRVCDCCQTSATATPAATLVAYRDRTEAEIRDISVATNSQEGRPIHNDAWKFAGCPVNGPALAAREKLVAAAWFTAAAGQPKVLVSFQQPQGAFESPVEVHRGQAIGRVSITWLDATRVAVTFVEARNPGGERAQIVTRTVSTTGTLGPAYQVADTENSRAAGFPKMATVGSEIVWAWTDVSDPNNPKVQVAKAPF